MFVCNSKQCWNKDANMLVGISRGAVRIGKSNENVRQKIIL